MPPELVVTVVFCPAPAQSWECSLTLPAGSTVADALMAAMAAGQDKEKNTNKNNGLKAFLPFESDWFKSRFGARSAPEVVARLQADMDRAGLSVGVWARVQPLAAPLADGDRVELYRALSIDPKEARRARFAQQGARGTGLFAKRRPGSKAGY